ncbi:MAG: CDP-alcohol phosphatidyltransferase family protein [bacterium]
MSTIDNKHLSIKELRVFQPEEKDPTWKFCLFFSIYITKLFLYTKISANQVSFLFCIVSLFAALLLMMGIATYDWRYFIGVPFFIYLYLILDCVDGEVARAKGTANPITGKVVDVLCHEIFDDAVIVAVTLGIYFRIENELALIIGLFLFFGKSISRRLEDIIIRVIRLHAQDKVREEDIVNVSTNHKIKRLIHYILPSNFEHGYIPYKGIFLIMICSLFGDLMLLGAFALWAFWFNLKWVYKTCKFFKAPYKYLK